MRGCPGPGRWKWRSREGGVRRGERSIRSRWVQLLEGLFGRGLLGVFLVLAGAGAVGGLADEHLDGERPVVIGALLGDRDVPRDAEAAGLGLLEELALEVLILGFHEPLFERLQDRAFDEPARGDRNPVEVDRSEK